MNITDSYEPFTVVPSQGSHRNHLIRDSKGFVYSFNGKTKDGNVTWRCNKRRTECKCKSYVRTQDQFIICHFYEHNHYPQFQVNKYNPKLQVFEWINTIILDYCFFFLSDSDTFYICFRFDWSFRPIYSTQIKFHWRSKWLQIFIWSFVEKWRKNMEMCKT